MVHLVMKFREDKPVFTGLAFANGATAAEVADNRNTAKDGYHYVLSAPLDTADDDDHEHLSADVENVYLVVANTAHEEVVLAVYSDEAAARLLLESRRAYHDTINYTIRPVKIHHVQPPGDDETPDLVAA